MDDIDIVLMALYDLMAEVHNYVDQGAEERDVQDLTIAAGQAEQMTRTILQQRIAAFLGREPVAADEETTAPTTLAFRPARQPEEEV